MFLYDSCDADTQRYRASILFDVSVLPYLSTLTQIIEVATS